MRRRACHWHRRCRPPTAAAWSCVQPAVDEVDESEAEQRHADETVDGEEGAIDAAEVVRAHDRMLVHERRSGEHDADVPPSAEVLAYAEPDEQRERHDVR